MPFPVILHTITVFHVVFFEDWAPGAHIFLEDQLLAPEIFLLDNWAAGFYIFLLEDRPPALQIVLLEGCISPSLLLL